MASKSKRQRALAAKKKESFGLVIFIASVASLLALLQNSYGQFSDIRGFYGMHFADGQHLWPYSWKTLIGATEPKHPVEYPALTGLIMWLFSFFIEPAQFAWVDYFRLTATFHIFLFALTAYFAQKLSNKKLALAFVLAPAVLYSLNRNWDIWAVLPMLIAIVLYERGKLHQSAIWLSVSIAAKLFPIVLLLPVAIIAWRKGQWKVGAKYIGQTLGYWLSINIPFMLINFEGWFYFYKFSYERAVGSASFFEIASIIGLPISSHKFVFYGFNLLALGLVLLFLVKSPRLSTLGEGAFFTMFAFILFNKQYSMQYIIWLAVLAVIAMYRLSQTAQMKMFFYYIVWQATDLLFQWSFFQKILTGTYANTATPASPAVSNELYGWIGAFRYLSAVAFVAALSHYLYREGKATQSQTAKA